MEPFELKTPRLLLRPFRLADAPEVQRLAGDSEVARYTLAIPHPYEDGMAEQWISAQLEPSVKGHFVVNLAVTEREGGALMGCVGLAINSKQARGELGYWIGRPFWNQGYATEASRAIIDHAFRSFEIERVEANHMTLNPASGRVMEKLGMGFEGISRHGARRHGQFHDLARYGVLRGDWVGDSR